MKRVVLALAAIPAAFAACSPSTPPVPPAAASVSEAQDGPGAYRGAAVAGQVCAQCHDIGNGATPAQNIGAPDFQEIASRPASTSEGLAEWMRTNHPKMPNYLFSGQEVADLAEYITSLGRVVR